MRMGVVFVPVYGQVTRLWQSHAVTWIGSLSPLPLSLGRQPPATPALAVLVAHGRSHPVARAAVARHLWLWEPAGTASHSDHPRLLWLQAAKRTCPQSKNPKRHK